MEQLDNQNARDAVEIQPNSSALPARGSKDDQRQQSRPRLVRLTDGAIRRWRNVVERTKPYREWHKEVRAAKNGL